MTKVTQYALMALLVFSSSISFAKVMDFSTIISSAGGSDWIVVGQNSAKDSVWVESFSGNFTSISVQDLLTFGVDVHHPTFYGNNMNVKIQVKVFALDENDDEITNFTQNLEIKYHPFDDQEYVDKQTLEFYGVKKFTYEIEKIFIDGIATDTLPQNLYLEAVIKDNRNYQFDNVAGTGIGNIYHTFLDNDCDGTNDEILIGWDPLDEAEEYQLEWTHVNNYGANGLGSAIPDNQISYNFKYNSTRISTVDNKYPITLAFDKGYLLYRVRAIGTSSEDNQTPLFSVWSGNPQGLVSAHPDKYLITQAYHNNLNWSFSSTFAEEGKKKEVAAFSDGTLRNRQTVSQINADKQSVVMEQIYDYQGRPVINTLPAPVNKDPNCSNAIGENASTLKFYPAFTQNTSGEVYGPEDFDKDTNCSSITAAMGDQNGSGKYYSPNNPDQNGFQAFVPDAKGFPFSQIEYYNDNTGRVRRQSLVGPEFIIDGNHATKFFYAKPDQIELDRLFGSEVGFAPHYRKNAIIDPNGQVAVTYLDQQGRTIATALAGDNPSNLQGISSEANALANISTNLFSVNPEGNSLTNNPNADLTAIEFHEQFVVSHPSNHSFNYTLNFDSVMDPCLASNICMHCVYNLEIKVLDDCGAELDLQADVNGGSFSGIMGKFVQNGNDLEFVTSCGNTQINETIGFTLSNLPVGTYDLIKTLKINPDAMDFYVEAYLSEDNNNCIQTLDDFITEYMNNIDTSGCNITCEVCVAELGSQNDYVASGLGSAEEWSFLVEECQAPCRTITQCQLSYNQMLVDMSPGNQYGGYDFGFNNTVVAFDYPLSIYNSGNKLPTSQSGNTVTWKNPMITLNGQTYPYYVDENGIRSKIVIEDLGNNTFSPAVVSTGSSVVFYDAQLGSMVTYPENLAELSDFISHWNTSWSKSLVQYHPEYCLYELCAGYGEKVQENDYKTVDEYASALYTLGNNSNLAQTLGLLSSSLPHTPIASNWFTSNGQWWDPFVVYSTTFDGFGAQLQAEFNNFNGSGYSMAQIAASMARCPGGTGDPANATCFEFGASFPGNPSLELEIWNTEWKNLIDLYISKRQELMGKRSRQKELTCGAVNNCFGESEFNPFSVEGFFSPFSPYPNYFSAQSPCGWQTKNLYINKQKRFFSDDDLPTQEDMDPNVLAYQMFMTTGQCPNALGLQNLLTDLAGDQLLDNSGILLHNTAGFTALHLAYNNWDLSVPIPERTWNSTISGDQLIIQWLDENSNPACEMVLDKNGNSFAWDDISTFLNLYAVNLSVPNGVNNFTATAVQNPGIGQAAQAYSITGSISCYEIFNCAFPQECEANEMALDLQDLFNILLTENKFTSTTDVALDVAPYQSFISTNPINNAIDNDPTILAQPAWKYQGTSSDRFLLKGFGSSIPFLWIKFSSAEPASFNIDDLSAVAYFDHIASAYENYFTIDAYDVNGQFLATITGSGGVTFSEVSYHPLSFGDCDHPTPAQCQGPEFDVSRHLINLFNEVIVGAGDISQVGFNGASNWTNLLSTYVSGPHLGGSDNFYVQASGAITYFDSLNIYSRECPVTLWRTGKNVPELHFDNIVEIESLTGFGELSTTNTFYDFYMIANYLVGGNIYQDTIFGTSCFPIVNCDPCEIATQDPLNIQWNPITYTLPVTQECEDNYNLYASTITSYNTFVTNSPAYNLPLVQVIRPLNQFTLDGYCFCAEGYIAQLKAIMTLNFEDYDSLKITDIDNFCIDMLNEPCRPKDTIVISPIVDLGNPCLEQMINQTIENAENAFKIYIDSANTAIAQLYRSTCLSANESLVKSYQLKEYHYTLYYYDQAGNLIKTVPPEGVQPLNITSDSDPLKMAVDADRYNGTHLVTTQHRLATSYLYNSLNQLIRQSMPDMDKMDVWDMKLPGGIHQNLVVTGSHCPDAQNCYLSGYIKDAGKEYGVVYKSNDGGKTWSKVNDLAGANINKVQIIGTVGYAIGDKGIVLKSSQNNSVWTLGNTYQVGKFANLNDLFFFDNTPNTGWIVGQQGTVLSTSDGGLSFVDKSANIPGISPSDNITSITHDGNKFIIGLQRAGQSLFFSTTNSGSTWLAMDQIRVTDLNAIHLIDDQNGFAVGTQGTLLKTTDGGNTWSMVNTAVKNDFLKVYFINTQEGIAIRKNQSNANNGLYKTNDGGQSWTQMGNANDHYNGIFEYETSGTNAQVIALGDNGLIKRVVLNAGTSFGLININSPASIDLYAAHIEKSSNQFMIMVAGESGIIYQANTTGQGSPLSWNAIATGITGADANFRSVAFINKTSTLNEGVFGVLVSQTGKLYNLYKAVGGSAYQNAALISANGTGSGLFKKIVLNPNASLSTNNAAVFVALKSGPLVGNNLYRIPVTGNAAPSNAYFINATNYANIYDLEMHDTHIALVGLEGQNYRCQLSGGTGISGMTDQTFNVKPLPITDIESGSQYAIAVGAYGSIFQNYNNSQWKLVQTNLAGDFNDIEFFNTQQGFIAGNNGSLLKFTTTSTTLNLTDLSVTGGDDFKAVATGPAALYVAGKNGALYFSDDISSNNFKSIGQGTGQQFNAIGMLGNNAILGGNNGQIFWAFGSTTAQNTNVYLPAMRDVHFYSAQHGYAVGDQLSIRKTNNGGITWDVIVPNTPFSGNQIPEIKAVKTQAFGNAYVVGSKKYIAKIDGNTLQTAYLPEVATINFNDVDITNDGVLFAVGSKNSGNAKQPFVVKTNNYFASAHTEHFENIDAALYSVWAFDRNNTAIVAGANKFIRQYQGGNSYDNVFNLPGSGIPANFAINDIFFHDDKNGYFVGTSGLALKTKDFETLGPNSTYTGGEFDVKTMGGDIDYQTNASHIQMNTVWFSTRYDGFIAGEFTQTGQFNDRFARIINDESGLFSQRHWYDALGRPAVSQNSKQYKKQEYVFSLYDYLGRITTTGLKAENTSTAKQFPSIFGDDVQGHFNPNTIHIGHLAEWVALNEGSRTEVTRSYYDARPQELNLPLAIPFENMRKRVASITYEKVDDNLADTYNSASHYSYDIHGNVNTLHQENKNTGITSQQFKRMDYTYDLISGNTNEVRYQSGQKDQWLHKYTYDADNRITEVRTSDDGIHWDMDAKYLYYQHGPLARMEIGENKVQGVDYVYNLQGWLKGVNSNTLDAERDPGQDGLDEVGNPNALFARDVYGFSLGFFENDYLPIAYADKWANPTDRFIADVTGSDLLADRQDLYNGNIGYMVTTLSDSLNQDPLPMGYSYNYDQLNRLLSMKAWDNIDISNNSFGSGLIYDGKYENTFEYDANGNILKQLRKNGTGMAIDSLTYHYHRIGVNANIAQNRLYNVRDAVPDADHSDDIDNQIYNGTDLTAQGNYTYTEIGELATDKQEEIAAIKWRADSKIDEIIRTSGSNKKNLKFEYDPSGNRIAKNVYNSNGTWLYSTIYVRDAAGNVMAVYEKSQSSIPNTPGGSNGGPQLPNISSLTYKVTERYIYGANRLGKLGKEVRLTGGITTAEDPNPFGNGGD